MPNGAVFTFGNNAQRAYYARHSQHIGEAGRSVPTPKTIARRSPGFFSRTGYWAEVEIDARMSLVTEQGVLARSSLGMMTMMSFMRWN